jgi:hypothetical protein
MPLDTFAQIQAHILERGYEDSTDLTGDFFTLSSDAIIEAWRDIATRWPILEWRKSPVGAFITVASITTTTLTIAAAGEAVAATLSVAPATSIVGRKIKPTGKEWYAIVTAHTAGDTAVTLDVAQEAIAAGTACTIYKDEYTLNADLGLFVDGLWYPTSKFVALKSEEYMRSAFPVPHASDIPEYFARIGQRTIRLSSYPTSVKRVEYLYSFVPDDPSGTTTLAIPTFWRPALAELALAILIGMKFDRRENDTMARAERMIERCITYEKQRMSGLQTKSPTGYRGAYGA